MKTDRELLELAAKAAGMIPQEFAGSDAFMDGVLERWNPLRDDGDALRLAVDLKLDIKNYEDYVSVWYDNYFSVGPEYFYGDPKAATRRAITRAAAQMQLSKEQDNGK